MTTELTFPGNLPGNNGPKGILRMHWAKKRKFIQRLFYLVKSMTKNKHAGPVGFKLIRYSTGRLMDMDNLVSTGKFPTDTIVMAGVIIDDKPEIIQKREYEQIKCKKGEQRTVIIITDL